MRSRRVCAFVTALALIAAAPSYATELLRVGKSVPEAFSFVPLDVGLKQGLFRKYGLDIEASSLAGGARLQQALAADSLDIGLGSGPEMSAIEKGSPVKAAAAMARAPRLLALLVRPDDAIKSVDDLRGKKIGVTTLNSLTAWLASELAPTRLGAGRDRGDAARRDGGAVRRAQDPSDRRPRRRYRDLAAGRGARRGQDGEGFPHPRDLRHQQAERPDAIRAFLNGWFDTIAFMRADKDSTVAIAKDIIGVDAAITARTYDELMPMFSADGRFDAKALAVLSRSYVELKSSRPSPTCASSSPRTSCRSLR
jgi:NitT/TauT family transport system substrate-binding protein